MKFLLNLLLKNTSTSLFTEIYIPSILHTPITSLRSYINTEVLKNKKLIKIIGHLIKSKLFPKEFD